MTARQVVIPADEWDRVMGDDAVAGITGFAEYLGIDPARIVGFTVSSRPGVPFRVRISPPEAGS
jgi:hypothetical protein